MSWFDTAGIASLAKNALKEAQKQIDKALDIKDEEEPVGPSGGSTIERLADGTADGLSSPHGDSVPPRKLAGSKTVPTTPVAGEGVSQPKEPLTAQVSGSVWGSFTGSFFEPSPGSGLAHGNTVGSVAVAVTKPPASLKRKSFEESGSSELPKMSIREETAGSLGNARGAHQAGGLADTLSPTEKDSSESIEVLSPATTPGSALTSPSQLSPCVTGTQDESESVEVIGGTLGTVSSDSSPDSITANESCSVSVTEGPEVPEERRTYRTVTRRDLETSATGQLDSAELDDEISVEDDDSLSYTLSEQPITVMETTGGTAAPITVAPGRSSLHLTLSLSTGTLPQDVHPAMKLAISEVSATDTEESNDSEVTLSEQWNSAQEKQQQQQQDEQDLLDRSYENVEIQTEISDSTQSFEELTVGSSGGGSGGDAGGAGGGDAGGDSSPNSAARLEPYSVKVGRDREASGGNASVALMAAGTPNDDEIETATSSDIEIISSPNGGDSSSTNSGAYRTSPLKLSGDGKTADIEVLLIKKQRGHTREPSEISVHSGNSDESASLPEAERSLRRIAELSELLEQREFRLVELGRQNAELQEQNAQLLLAQQETRAKRAADGSADAEGYTQRLSALERKFQCSIREKETLRRQYEALRAESQGRVQRSEMEKALAERDFMISELRKEGEGLSKQVLQHSTIIKKLRVKERENEAALRKQRDEIAELTEEAERLKRSLSAKEEVERSQIDAVHKLSSEKRKLERECATLKGQLDDHVQRLETLRKSFDFARKELNEQSESYQGLLKRSTKLQSVESEYGAVVRQNELLGGQVEELREQLRRAEHEHGQRLVRMKAEHTELLQRLEETEARAEQEKNASAQVTVPLMRQLEALETVLRQKERQWEQRETSTAQQLAEAAERAREHADKERSLREQIASLQSRIANLEERLTVALSRAEEMNNGLLQRQLDADLLERDYRQRLAASEDERRSLADRVAHQERHIVQLEQTAGREQREREQQEQRVQHLLQTQQRTHEVGTSGTSQRSESPTLQSDRRQLDASPTPSMGNVSLSESLASIPWTVPDVDGDGTTGPQPPSSAPVGSGAMLPLNNTSLLETLQATLKQRDGEVHQLQWELSRFQQERNVLSTEITNLTMELDGIREQSERSGRLQEEHAELQKRYDALLQMYGESMEKTQELQLDLLDVKEMYKLQINDLLRQQRELTESLNRTTAVPPPSVHSSAAAPSSDASYSG
ncbi:TATA element modulatory factor-like [Anopheles albimanus]|uniref:TMF_TATA_bd domain-containing protein n=1 Tax=Anopheles albimanus TaxID=7167 RepID=A0A182FJS3_ANOAL|nr:TATA element modulatory factor-like [Anopheles albimanus]